MVSQSNPLYTDNLNPSQVDIPLNERTLAHAIDEGRKALLQAQEDTGLWCFELEADCTIPAEYILMMHFVGEVDFALQKKMATYLRAQQQAEGGWPLYYAGEFDMSCSVKCYYALKLAGDDPSLPHMQKAREIILKNGGAAKSNVFTRITLALFEQLPWRGVPYMPVEILLFPKWFPFHLSKVSYWSRTVTVPLLILCTLKAKAQNPTNVSVSELFVTPAFEEKDYFPVRSTLNYVFIYLSYFGSWCDKFIPKFIRKKALKKAENWFIERLNGEHGLGAIFPAMVNAYESLLVLGYEKSHPLVQQSKKALLNLVLEKDTEAYCQPCFSPVWDTAISCLALQSENPIHNMDALYKGCDWLLTQQLIDDPGDWRDVRPDLTGGGWPFQYQNHYYPDLDDTAMVGWLLHLQNHDGQYTTEINLAAEWLVGMQSQNGGFASFEVDNTHYYLNEIPFADHGALLDPPTSDVSARVVTFLSLVDKDKYQEPLEKCVAYLLAEQEPNGSWFGRWGTNYIYGTWSVLMALKTYGLTNDHPAIVKAVNWLKEMQHADGGWGEDNGCYFEPPVGDPSISTTFQTAWALLALIACEDDISKACQSGVQYLLSTQNADGFWDMAYFTCPGFPRVFYLKYHGYYKYFPLWALSEFRKKIEP